MTPTNGPHPESKPSILLVDDLSANLLALEAILGDLGANLVRARSGEEALRRLLAEAAREKRIAEELAQKAHELERLNREFRAEVAERRRTEASLRASEDRFRALAETVPDVIFTAGPDGGCDYLNPRFYEYTGLAAGSGLGDGWAAALHPDDAGPAAAHWRACREAGLPFEFRYRFRGADGGYRWFIGRARPVRAAHG